MTTYIISVLITMTMPIIGARIAGNKPEDIGCRGLFIIFLIALIPVINIIYVIIILWITIDQSAPYYRKKAMNKAKQIIKEAEQVFGKLGKTLLKERLFSKSTKESK